MDESEQRWTRPKGPNPASRGGGVGGHKMEESSATLERSVYGYLGWGISTDPLMEQLRGPVDHL